MSATPAVVSSKDVTLLRSNGGWIRTPRVLTSDMSSSSDDFQAKVRKPYTITKQREKWTEQEHEKFLEALKLYGRSWRHIKEHIGTKTAVQIRSHAQKFFFKLEQGASDNGSNGQVQEIEIPPPRPKRKPNHPYPRKRGISTSLCEEIGDTHSTSFSMAKMDLKAEVIVPNWKRQGVTMSPTLGKVSPIPTAGNDPCNCSEVGVSTTTSNSSSTGYSLPTNPTAFSSLADIKGRSSGSLRCEVIENRKPTASEASKHNCQQAEISLQGFHKKASYKEGNIIIKSQPGLHTVSEETHIKALTSINGINASLSVPSKTNVSVVESTRHPEAKSAHIHSIIEGSCAPLDLSKEEIEPSYSESNPPPIWMDHLINNHGSSRDLQTARCGPAQKQSTSFSPSWQLMQASLMNHPAAFAAAMATAAAWAFIGTGAASKADNCMQPSAEDLNAAAYAAASASWWAFNGFVYPPLSHQGHNAVTALTFSQPDMPTTKDNKPEQAQFAGATAMQTEEVPACVERSEKFNIKEMPRKTLGSDTCTIPNNDAFMVHNQRENQKNPTDELDGLPSKVAQEGSSSGSNTPALRCNSRSPSENDNEENFCQGIEEGCTPPDNTIHESAFRAVGEEGYVKMKHKHMERGKHQHEDSLRQGENENGKRFKSGAHDIDTRKEVSLQGRKAFQALFTGSTLPQKFGRGGKEGVQKDAESQTGSGRLKHSDVLQAEAERVGGSVECAMVMEGGAEPNNNSEPFGSECNAPFPGTSTSMCINSRIGTSGFSPYKKPSVESRASACSSTR